MLQGAEPSKTNHQHSVLTLVSGTKGRWFESSQALVLELARGEFIDRKENVLALGNSGTGKTHIALALGLAACQKGYRVRFTTAASLVHELLEAKDEKRLLRLPGHRPPLQPPC